MQILGLTGGSGSGKGYVAALFAAQGIPSIDCDEVSRQICTKGSPCLCELAEALGSEVLAADGSYDRAATAKIVFSDRDKLNLLNRITHRYILAECRTRLTRLREEGIEIAIVDAPVLYESGFDSECDAVAAVIAEERERIRRIVKRDGISEEMARMRISKQHSETFYRQKADYIIENGIGVTREMLEKQIERIRTDLARREAAP